MSDRYAVKPSSRMRRIIVAWMSESKVPIRADASSITSIVNGVCTPIIRSAESTPVWEIASEDGLVCAAQPGTSLNWPGSPEVHSALLEPGMHDFDQFDAIPKCKSLAVGHRQRSPQINRRAQLPSVRVTLAVNHRLQTGLLKRISLRVFRCRNESPWRMSSSARLVRIGA